MNKIFESIPPELQKSENETEARNQEKMMEKGEYFVRSFFMFSATYPPQIKDLAKKYLKHETYVQIGDLGSAKKEIKQVVEFLMSKNHKK